MQTGKNAGSDAYEKTGGGSVMATGLVARSLSKVREIVTNAAGLGTPPQEKQLEQARQKLGECAESLGGEVSTRQRAAELARLYLSLDDEGRHAFLRMIALEFGPDPQRVAVAHENYQNSIGTPEQWDAEAELRKAMRSSRIRILTQFNAIPQGVKYLVDLRADLLRFLKNDPELKALDRELESRLTAWFDVGFLELTRLTWNTPAALLEKIVEYEAVHEINSWADLKNRLGSDRRCYAFFHPRMPMEPLIFVEVALLRALADSVQHLLDEQAPVADPDQATTAIFYSISNTQAGLRGVSFGNFLLKRVIDDLKHDFPKLRTFATLSPIPGMLRWLRQQPEVFTQACTPVDWKRLADAGISGSEDLANQEIITHPANYCENAALLEALREPLLKVAAQYLLEAKRGILPLDPVARFHLGNGARVERLNWQADTSTKGWQQSWGIMVNYLYDPERLEDNIEAHVRGDPVAASPAVRRLAAR